jgi:ectoine hydroxylase-related dioxygenase (phytanoyl-CoA dioxygenase family)
MAEVNEVEKGFNVMPRVFSSAECDSLLDGIINGSISRGRAGVRNLMRNAVVRTVSEDDRLVSIAKRFLGNNAIPFRATLFAKSGRANWLVIWHQDTVLPIERRIEADHWGPWSTKAGVLFAHAPRWALDKVIALRIHLDDSTVLNGPLRVIPGTHALGVLPESKVIRIAHAQNSIDCICEKGGVIAMRPLLIHASSKVIHDMPRRVLHIEYTDSLDFTDDVRIAIA